MLYVPQGISCIMKYGRDFGWCCRQVFHLRVDYRQYPGYLYQ